MERRVASAMRAACVASCFFSAVLMFALEPMLARMLLPAYGGSPAVWNTAMVVFQVLLVLGYLYSHRLLGSVSPARQSLVHGALLVLSLVFVPPALRELSIGADRPVAGIALVLIASAGLPFFVLATNATLTQQWFARGEAKDPAWLYAASNAGSLAALAGYPFVFDRWFGLRAQSTIWGYCYAAFVLLTLAISVVSWKLLRGEPALPAEVQAVREPVSWSRQVGWLGRSAVASSLLLSVTLRISVDAGAGPMFWTIPLALYLSTFVLAFAKDNWIPRRLTLVGVVLAICGCLTMYLFPWPLGIRIGLSLLLLFFGSLLCHTDVAHDRPGTAELPRYFLVIAIGGAVGGLLNSVVAPLLFDSVAEFPLTLLALALCLARKGELAKLTQLQHWRRPQSYVVPVTMALATLGALLAVQQQRAKGPSAAAASLFILCAVLAIGVTFLREPGAFQLGVAIVAAFVLAGLTERNHVSVRARSFFSTLKVVETPHRRSFVHGGVVHGREYKDPTRKFEIPYYGPRAPLSRAVNFFPGPARIGVVGLGAGVLAAGATREQTLTFYELDPLVHTIAFREFSFLRNSKAKVDHVFGDARLTLKDVPAAHFNVLLLDAFSGDGVPMHLLTREAIDMYQSKLVPDGLLIFHVSNNYVDLSRVLRGYARETGSKMLIARYRPTPAERDLGAFVVDAVATSRSEATLRRLDGIEPWNPLPLEGPSALWTDDHHDIIAVMDWRRLRGRN